MKNISQYTIHATIYSAISDNLMKFYCLFRHRQDWIGNSFKLIWNHSFHTNLFNRTVFWNKMRATNRTINLPFLFISIYSDNGYSVILLVYPFLNWLKKLWIWVHLQFGYWQKKKIWGNEVKWAFTTKQNQEIEIY